MIAFVVGTSHALTSRIDHVTSCDTLLTPYALLSPIWLTTQ